ncbi:hypothetical protein TrST_g10091 [Triparma strigata]|uniref:Uncharacterized protein n=1 Tax=Triparma strigata TaxID=1606541 RepID=A0A9W7A817_9STRA|nr:hypothetical protein TrST_g10091 [Triparma strigata]
MSHQRKSFVLDNLRRQALSSSNKGANPEQWATQMMDLADSCLTSGTKERACINFILNSPNSFGFDPKLHPWLAPTLSKAVRQELNIKPYHCNFIFPELQVDLSGIATSGFSAVFTETCNKIGSDFTSHILANTLGESAADSWILQFPALEEVDQTCP